MIARASREGSPASMGKRWFLFALVYFCGFASFYNMFKAPPLFTSLIADLGFTGANIGLMMSVFSILGIILAFPAGLILGKLGPKRALLVTVGSFVVGSLIGAFATTSTVLLASRFVEGIGLGFISVVGSSAVSFIIPKRKQGLAMGIWGTIFPLGTIGGMNLAPLLYASFGWQAAWWAGAIIAGAAFLIILFLFNLPAPVEEDAASNTTGLTASPADSGSPVAEGVASGAEVIAAKTRPDVAGIVLLAITFGIYNVIWAGAFNSFYPTFLQEVHGMTVVAASFAVSVTSIINLFAAPAIGVLSDKLGTRKWIVLVAMALMAVLCTIGFGTSIGIVWLFIILISFCGASVPTGTFSLAPELARKPESVGFAMSTISFFQNIGIMTGSAVFGILATSVGWSQASLFFLVPLAALAAVLTFFIKEKRKKGA